MTEQQTIDCAIVGRRIVAASWLPLTSPEGTFELESITLEGGVKLNCVGQRLGGSRCRDRGGERCQFLEAIYPSQ